MAFTLNSLTNYTDVKNTFLTEALNSLTGIDLLYKVPGVKSPTVVNTLTNTVYFQSEAGSRTASGDTSISEVLLNPCQVTSYVELKPHDLEPHFAAYMTSGSYYDGLPFEQYLYQAHVGLFKQKLEEMIFMGDVLSSTNNLKRCDGIFIKLRAASASTTNATWVSLIPSTAVATVDAYLASAQTISAIANKRLNMIVPFGQYQNYLMGIRTANWFDPSNFGPANSGAEENGIPLSYNHPGSNLWVHGVPNISSTYGKGVICVKDSLIFGYDAESDTEGKGWFSQDKNRYCIEISCKVALGVALPAQIVRLG